MNVLRTTAAAVALASGWLTQAHAATLEETTALVARYGNIIERSPMSVGGLTAWVVEKNGNQVTLFTTADGSALFSGVVWDARTGRNLSDQYAEPRPQAAAPQVSAPAPVAQPSPQPPQMSPLAVERALPANTRMAAAMDGRYTGAVSESMKTVDSLAGYKEGSGGIGDTVYIIIDPRCPYCQQAYNVSRQYVKRGATIKWIPSLALGQPEQGGPLAAAILRGEQPDVVERILGKHEQLRVDPTDAEKKALATNLAFLFAAFKNNGDEPAGVPVAFFIDHRTGKPRMLSGVSDVVVQEDIFGRP